jgi:peptidylglycine monooxygenase
MHKPASEDSSGLRVASTMEPQPKTAATLLMATDGHIPAKKTEHLEVACVVDEPVTMHPFAFRVRFGLF